MSVASATSRTTASAEASASAARRGAEVRALEEEALAVHLQHPAPQPHLAQPGAQPALVAGRPALVGAEGDAHDQVVEHGIPQGAGPPQRGPVHRERPLHLVVAGRERVVELVVLPTQLGSAGTPCGRRRCPGTARRTTTARPAVASRQLTRSAAMRTGPVSRMCTGRQMPPGFQAGSIASQCWKTPVRLRLAVRSPGRSQVTSTARWCSRRSASASVTSKACGAK